MRILVLGGDGFCGWPTTLYLSDRGHEVTILDNLSRRKIDIDLEVQSLTPIRPVGERRAAWREISGREVGFVQLDLAVEYEPFAAVREERGLDVLQVHQGVRLGNPVGYAQVIDQVGGHVPAFRSRRAK